ncbi:MAG TPA: sigma factor-like helix-turn-helix DNA-binding protein [Candidatus Melainabacteria bacterium]|nr:sigma factor-like helix-turn-helix DNA-binding protein [Candidatus Melainabacteria bacterium]
MDSKINNWRLLKVPHIFEPGDIVRLKDPDNIDYDSELERDLDLKKREYSHLLLTIDTEEKLSWSVIYYLLLKKTLVFKRWHYVALPLKDKNVSQVSQFSSSFSAGDMQFLTGMTTVSLYRNWIDKVVVRVSDEVMTELATVYKIYRDPDGVMENADKIRVFILENRGKLEQLNPMHREFLQLRYGLVDDKFHSLEELTAYFDIELSRLRAMEERALRKLRHIVERA